MEVTGAGCASFSSRMELMKVVGERGVSTGAATSSKTGHTSTSGLDGSSLMSTDGLSLRGDQVPLATYEGLITY